MDTMQLPDVADYLAPDGSEIRVLPTTAAGGLSHCTLPSGKTSIPVRHQTVEEIWFVMRGEGEIWRRYGQTQTITQLRPGVAVKISFQAHFQFRNTGTDPLAMVIATFPAWPGPSEAVKVDGARGW
jgi:mannose-6-phosphate isomerase-like protein (cupin superfamily)